MSIVRCDLCEDSINTDIDPESWVELTDEQIYNFSKMTPNPYPDDGMWVCEKCRKGKLC